MLVSIDKRTAALATVLAAGHFAVNFLPRGAKAIADSFGGKGELKGAERFQIGSWKTLTTGAPVLENALGAMDCKLEETIERDGICIVIGRVRRCFDCGRRRSACALRGGYL